jgi:hypothetical protein
MDNIIEKELNIYTTWQLNVGKVKQEEAAVAMKRRGKCVSAATCKHATINEDEAPFPSI